MVPQQGNALLHHARAIGASQTRVNAPSCASEDARERACDLRIHGFRLARGRPLYFQVGRCTSKSRPQRDRRHWTRLETIAAALEGEGPGVNYTGALSDIGRA